MVQYDLSLEPIESEWSQLQEFSVSRVTLTDVAQHTGVSIATAHRALQDKPGVAAKKAHAIRRAAREMGYPFGRRGGNSASRSQTLSVGLRPCENFRDGTFSDDPRMVSIISAFQQSSQELGLNACVEVTKLSRETLRDSMAFGRHDGLLLLGHHAAEQGRLLQDAGMPFVSLLDSVPGIEHSKVVDDYASAISQSVQYLLLLGHKRIALLHGNLEWLASRTQLSAFEGLLAEWCIDLPEGYIHCPEGGGLTHRAGHESVNHFVKLSPAPTAIICGNDWSAVGVLDRLDELGLRVPRDVSVIGLDDTPWSRNHARSLTTAGASSKLLVQRALRTLTVLCRGQRTPVQEIVECRLVKRGSCGPAPKEDAEA